jgi:hypothetical protein
MRLKVPTGLLDHYSANKPRAGALKVDASIIELEAHAVIIFSKFMSSMIKASDIKFDNREVLSQKIQQTTECLVNMYKRNFPHKAYISYLEQIVSDVSPPTAIKSVLSEFDISKSILDNFAKEKESCLKV